MTATLETSVAGDEAATNGTPPPSAMNQRRVLGLAVPIIGENLLQTAVGAVDTLMVARLGKEAVAGVGTSIEVVFFIISALSAVSIGATVLISQAFGAGNVGRASQIARQALVWGILLAIPVSILGFFAAGTVISVFGTEPDVAEHATTYLEITAATSGVLLLTFVCGAIFRGVGDSRTPLKASIVANVVNVGVAYVLIFGHVGMPKLGVAGSAWAAAAGRGVAALILIAILLRGRRTISLRGREGWQPRVQLGRQLLKLGFPAAIEQMLMSAGFMVMMAVVALLGTVALAAQQIGFTALSIAFMPGFGFSMAATALVGQSVGARNIANARIAARIAMVWGIAWMAIGGLIYIVFARFVMQAFTSDKDVIADGVRALRALAIGLPFWAIWSVNGGALRGSGDTKTPMIMSVTTVWLAVALAFGAVRWLDAGLGIVWLTFLVTSPIGALGNWLTLRRRLAPNSSVLSTVANERPPVAAATH